MLSWANRFNIFCFLDNQDYSLQPHRYDCLLAAGAHRSISSSSHRDIDQFLAQSNGWVFGHLAYGLKDVIHGLPPAAPDRTGFPLFHFFEPDFLCRLHNDGVTITALHPDAVYKEILAADSPRPAPAGALLFQPALTREMYLQTVRQLQEHILRGDCYEINFCQSFRNEGAVIHPQTVYERLAQVSPMPFSAFYRLNDSYLICASPERFLTRTDLTILSQPMKGTIRRNLQNEQEDEALKRELKHSAKDQSENVMVVDLVRNDLSRICRDGTVGVDELFGVYSYPKVHQMISTVSGELLPGVTFSEILDATFPMGSMTGAPKHRVMELIDTYEPQPRGIFSGSVGYFDPEGNFDFNVVIRSIMYNNSSRLLWYAVGSGITFYSDPEKEWDECELKAAAIREVLAGS